MAEQKTMTVADVRAMLRGESVQPENATTTEVTAAIPKDAVSATVETVETVEVPQSDTGDEAETTSKRRSTRKDSEG